MAQIISFPGPNKIDIEAKKLLDISNEIDNIVLKHLMDGEFEPYEVAGLLAHRLGNLLKHMDPEEKEAVWQACRGILAKQAELEETA